MPDIEHQVLIVAPPDWVWPALTTNQGLSRWWSLGETVLAGDAGRLGHFEFRSRAVVTRLKVVALDAQTRLVWRTIESNAPGGWNGTSISFDLTALAGGTRLDFAHRGFAEDNDGYRKVTAGWAHYLNNLKVLVETGEQGADS